MTKAQAAGGRRVALELGLTTGCSWAQAGSPPLLLSSPSSWHRGAGPRPEHQGHTWEPPQDEPALPGTRGQGKARETHLERFPSLELCTSVLGASNKQVPQMSLTSLVAVRTLRSTSSARGAAAACTGAQGEVETCISAHPEKVQCSVLNPTGLSWKRPRLQGSWS